MRILLLSSYPDDISFYEGVAQKSGFDLVKTSSEDELCKEILKDDSAIIVAEIKDAVHYTRFEKLIADKIGLFNDKIEPNRIFFTSSKDLHELAFLAKSTIFGHFIPRIYNDSDQERIAYLLKAAASSRPFGIETYFKDKTQVQNITLTHSHQKQGLVESIREFLVKSGFKSRVAAVITTAADEILMNAIFDAPTDELGKPKYLQTPRSAAIELNDKSKVEVRIAFDGTTFGLSVTDPFGSLERKSIIEHIAQSFENAEFKVKTSKAGAGLGLSNVYRSSGGLLFACEKGVKTEVILFYKKTDSFKDFKDQFHFLSTFVFMS